MLGISSAPWRFGKARAISWRPSYSNLEALPAAAFAAVEFKPREEAGTPATAPQTGGTTVDGHQHEPAASMGRPQAACAPVSAALPTARIAAAVDLQRRPLAALFARPASPRPVRRRRLKRRAVDPMVIAATVGSVAARGAVIRRDKPRPVERTAAGRSVGRTPALAATELKLPRFQRTTGPLFGGPVADLQALVIAQLAGSISARLAAAVTAIPPTGSATLVAGEPALPTGDLSMIAGRMRDLLLNPPPVASQRQQSA